MRRMVRLQVVKPLEQFNVRLEFTDGTQIYLESDLHGPIFKPVLKSINY
jgi:hypothetical protein